MQNVVQQITHELSPHPEQRYVARSARARNASTALSRAIRQTKQTLQACCPSNAHVSSQSPRKDAVQPQPKKYCTQRTGTCRDLRAAWPWGKPCEHALHTYMFDFSCTPTRCDLGPAFFVEKRPSPMQPLGSAVCCEQRLRLAPMEIETRVPTVPVLNGQRTHTKTGFSRTSKASYPAHPHHQDPRT